VENKATNTHQPERRPYFIRTSPATFDLEEKTLEQRQPWFDQFDTSGPYRLIVQEIDNAVVGFSCSSRLKEKAAYSSSIEVSIYVAEDKKGQGIATHLYQSLFKVLATESNLHRVYAGITIPNAGSIALHQKFGFESIGIYHEVGYKLGQYWDVEWFQKKL